MDTEIINTCFITTEEYSRLIRCASFLEAILAHKIDKSFPSEAEKEILRIQELMKPPVINPYAGQVGEPEPPAKEGDDGDA